MISLLSAGNSKSACPHPQSLAFLNNIQYAYLKSYLLNTKALLLNLTKCFNIFDTKVIPNHRLLDSFLDYTSFHSCNYSSLNNSTDFLKSLDYLCHKVASSFSIFVVVTDISAIPSRNM